jgi:hypothetical protein
MRMTLALLAFCSLSMFAADNPYIGTWKLNTARSTYKPGPPMKELTVKFESDGNNVRRIARGVDGQGKPVDQGGTEGVSFRWDGEFHTVTKPSEKPEVQVAVKVVDRHHLAVRIKMDGKITDNDRSSLSADGKILPTLMKG